MILAFLLGQLGDSNLKAKSFLQTINTDLNSGDYTDIKSHFLRRRDYKYLFDMKVFRPNLTAELIPRPPGYQNGKYWLIFSSWQDIELTADAVYRVYEVGGKFKIGKEVWEDNLRGWKIKNISYSAVLHPSQKSVSVTADLLLSGTASIALPFRLNQGIQLESSAAQPVLIAQPNELIEPHAGDLVRAGGLLIPWTDHPKKEYIFKYVDTPPAGVEDSITSHHAYVTAWWIPSLGRLPCPVQAKVTGPSSWHIRCEGNLVSDLHNGDKQTASYNCPLPISFPKIVAGQYTLMASERQNGETFHVWQVDPTDKSLALHDLQNMVRAADYYQSILGPLPFPGYSLYDSKNYYGIESYSHTLLDKSDTHFVTHEMGHSYFGGYAPCTYVHDAWNEGLTEFLDSVLLNHDADHTLESAFSSINDPTPLSKIRICWAHDNEAYMRGAYVMQMLESVIGKADLIKGMKYIVQMRVGKDTRWDDLRQYFEMASGKQLGWFWDQWIDNGVFPTLQVISKKTNKVGSEYQTRVVVEQSGTPLPFQLRFNLSAQGSGSLTKVQEEMTAPQEEYILTTPVPPDSVSVDIFGLTLAHIKKT